jgi:hypothetical protein
MMIFFISLRIQIRLRVKTSTSQQKQYYNFTKQYNENVFGKMPKRKTFVASYLVQLELQ